MRISGLLILTMMVVGCSSDNIPDTTSITRRAAAAPSPAVEPSPPSATRLHDESSYAQPERVAIADLELDLELDFDRKQLAGSATYRLSWKDDRAMQLVLDSRDLTIDSVEGERNGRWESLHYELAARDPVLGQKLTIQTPARNARVRVTYRTASSASGLQWLAPAMTEGGQTPFMFSQSQAIHARSWVPIQDTPGVRFTYTAHVRSPAEVMVLMSADNDPNALRTGDYRFRMNQPIPSYLLAIAAGDLVFKPLSERSGVWAEPAMIERAAQEFADTERMIQVTEQLYGSYRWERYDMLVLPPSFPFGGMENPRLTFVTPTVVVGDQSLVSLIAHELAHSWSGNLVTNASWKDIWLNEGFTTYVQSRIVEALYGEDAAQAERQIDQTQLQVEMARLPPSEQKLALDPLGGRDPDGVLTDVAYVKGAWFLQTLEYRYGREAFDAFLRGWFDEHAFQSVDTDQFIAYLKRHLLTKGRYEMSDATLAEWLEAPGIPGSAVRAASAASLASAETARIAWQGSGKLPFREVTDGWGTWGWVHFLEGMGATLTLNQLYQLDNAYHFSGTANGEIALQWYPLAIRSGYREAYPEMAAFLKRVGRRKLIIPIYQELAKTPEGLAMAWHIFEEARVGYHPITSASVEAVLSRPESP